MSWARWLVVIIAAGVCLLYGGVYLAAYSAYYLVDKRFFGLSTRFVLAVDDYVIWGIVGFVIGVLVGAILRSRPVLAALATCVASVLAFVVSVLLEEHNSFPEMLVIYIEPVIASFVFVTLGALLGVRLVRSGK